MILRYIEKLKENENSFIIAKNMLASLGIKLLSMLFSFMLVPAYLNYFGNQIILGIWFTMLSILAWILNFDLGIGNGLRNRLVPSIVEKNRIDIKKYITSAYISMSILVVIITIPLIFFIYSLNWNEFLNISTDVISTDVLQKSVIILFVGIMIFFLLKIINSILFAFQKSALVNFINLISNVFLWLYVTYIKTDDAELNLIFLSLAYVVAINIPLLVVTVYLFTTSLKEYRPNLKSFDKYFAKNVLSLGVAFLYIQVMFMLITVTNEILIAKLTNPKYVVEYQIYNQIFSVLGLVFLVIVTPIWSAVSKAQAEGNINWIKQLYKKLELFAFIALLVQLAIIPILPFIIKIWLPESSVELNYINATLFAIFGWMLIWNSVISTITNGFGELKTQAVYLTVGVLLKIPLSIFLVEYLNSWIAILLANIVSLGVYCIFQPIWVRKFLKNYYLKH